ncbi:MAG: hypothetical protein MRY64_12625 [Hyphomonadaceae bacterium]|nr:hypothetical protein [Hyphomonadaceae bacterium]
MKHHIMIALGLLMLVVFTIQAVEAFQAPGLGLREVYVLGGFVLSAWLIRSGFNEWKQSRK